jgi:hypothetical protein
VTDIAHYIEFAKAYNALGWAVQAQLDTLLEGPDDDGEYDGLDGNAVDRIEELATHLDVLDEEAAGALREAVQGWRRR